MDAYFEGEPSYFQKKREYLKKVHVWMDRLQKRQWQSRTKRCLKESTEFSVKREKGGTYYYRRDFALNQIREVLEDHLQMTKERPSELKKLSPEVIVSLLNNKENRVCVKQFRYPHFWNRFKEHFRRSKGLKAWVAGNGLRARGIPSLKPLGLLEKRDWLGLDASFFLMEALETGQEMDRYILNGFDSVDRKRLFIRAFAEWLSSFHKMALYHKDMKTCNILVSKDGESWAFHLLDLEDVRLDGKVSERELFKNFLQLNTSTPKIVTTADRFRFFKEYLRLNPIIKNRSIFLKRLNEESKQRGLVYVAPWGVVAEKLS